jgi:hypothetical protein
MSAKGNAKCYAWNCQLFFILHICMRDLCTYVKKNIVLEVKYWKMCYFLTYVWFTCSRITTSKQRAGTVFLDLTECASSPQVVGFQAKAQCKHTAEIFVVVIPCTIGHVSSNDCTETVWITLLQFQSFLTTFTLQSRRNMFQHCHCTQKVMTTSFLTRN